MKAGVFEVAIWHRGAQIASRPRRYERNGEQYERAHYLPLLEKQTRAVWNAQPVKAIGLPTAFWAFAKKLGSAYEDVKLLKHLAEYGLPALLVGMEDDASVGSYAYEAVRTNLEQGQYSNKVDKPILNTDQITQEDLSEYDIKLAGGAPA